MERGFTLIELLVVLVIISLVSAFVAPRITSPIGNLQLKTASKRIAGAMRYSRSLAVSEKEDRVCFFDFDKHQVLIFPASAFDVESPETVLKSGSPEVRLDLPAEVSIKKAVAGDDDIETGIFQVIFFANGSSSGGEIFLTNSRGQSSRIHVDFITGMVVLAAPHRAG